VRGTVVESVLAPGVVVEEGATIRHAVLLHDTVVRRGAPVAHAVVDRGVDVGPGARVGAAGGGDGRRPGIAVVGQHVRLEADRHVPPGACVDPDTTPRPARAARGRVER
jgi:glucose-1-phosphate adenylyltransferase